MLATRLATAAVLIPLIVAGIVLLPTWCVAVIFAVVAAIGAWEWGRLLGWVRWLPRILYAALFVLLMAAFGRLEQIVPAFGSAVAWLIGIACVWWVVVVYWLMRFPADWADTVGQPAVGALVGLLVLCAASAAVPAIHAGVQGPWLLLVFFALVWGADTGAYFAGRTLGRHKLAPSISPGKTREGAVGGVVAAVVVAVVCALLLGYGGARLAGFALLGAWIGIVSVFGDLTLSMFKRHAGVKDTGVLFPGHGGVLDRVDSILAAAPWFVVGLVWLPQG